MPLFEFRCKKCHAVTEVLCQGAGSENRAVNCAQCGSRAMSKVISRVSFKVAKPAKYSEAFLHNARPFLRAERDGAISCRGRRFGRCQDVPISRGDRRAHRSDAGGRIAIAQALTASRDSARRHRSQKRQQTLEPRSSRRSRRKKYRINTN